ncbi:MAG: FG-GAP repeat protein [Phycisphaerales bacterium]|nr:FG-GAP repeat protein [Phycisphaerales bacterium]MCB9864207.1 FG-GAP repeat protein [Phycisphaerales bacterium]
MNRRMIRSKLSVAALFVGVVSLLGMECPMGDGAGLNPPPADINTAPRIIITEVVTPQGNFVAEQGDLVEILFTAGDDEDRATVRVFAAAPSGGEIPILSNFQVGPGTANGTAFWPTNTVPAGSYSIFAEISDGTFDPNAGTGNRPIRVSALEPVLVNEAGVEVENAPPTLTVQLPASNAGLTNRDILTIRYTVSDPESNQDTLTARFFFDKDRNSSNDATQPPILLAENVIGGGTIPAGFLAQFNQEIEIDLNEVPTRVETDEGGRPIPYFVRVELSDGNNPVVNVYAVGSVQLLRAPSDVVDLQLVGGRTAGAILQGFDGAPDDPVRGGRAGAFMAPLGDLDGDGLADFVVGAETASPFNNPRVGEVYVIYGRERRIDPDLAQLLPFGSGRYAGQISLNTVGSFISFPSNDPRFNTIFNIRGHIIPQPASLGLSMGVTSAAGVNDLTGDGLPDYFIGYPYGVGIFDAEDDDPCDSCKYDTDTVPAFPCLNIVPRFVPNDLNSEVAVNDAIAANSWQPFDPANPIPFYPPTVDFELDSARITTLGSLLITIEGKRSDGQNLPFVMKLKLENADGPEIDVNILATDFTMDGEFTAEAAFVLDTPALPVAIGDPVPPSVYDGRFILFVRPTADVEELMLEVSSNAFIGEPAMTTTGFEIKTRYQDDFPNPFPDGPTIESGLNPIAIRDLDVACVPANRSRNPLALPGLGNRDGHVCADVTGFGVGCNGVTNDDLGGFLTASGYVFFNASDELVLPIFTGADLDNDGVPDDGPAGVWTGAGIRRPLEVLAGQRPAGGYRGGRIRGAWSQPSQLFDPESLFGYTVDVIPDIDTIFSPVAEVLVSAPAGGSLATPTAVGLTVQLGGEYSNDPNNATALVGTSAGFDFNARFNNVLQTSVFITGEAFGAPTLRVGLDDGNGNFIPGTVREGLLWQGADPPPDADAPAALNAGTILEDNIVFANNFVLPEPTRNLMLSGAGTLRIEIHEDCATKFSMFRVDSVQVSITGLLSESGFVSILEAGDYSSNNIEFTHCPPIAPTNGDPESDEARPMSWPSFHCRDGAVDTRILCGIQTVADIIGEEVGDALGFARHAGDINLDGVADIAMGAPGSDNDPIVPDINCGIEMNPLNNNGKSYIIFGTPTLGSGRPCDLPERIEVRGSHNDDQFGRVQGIAGDMDGDGNPDAYFAAELYDAMNVDQDGDGLTTDDDIGADAGYVGVLFGRQIYQNVTNSIVPEQVGRQNFSGVNFPGVKFIGGTPGARLGGGTPGNTNFFATEHGQHGVASAGDFNRDGNDDLLITAPGQVWPSVKIEFTGPVADGNTVVMSTGSLQTPKVTTFEYDFDNALTVGTAIPLRPATTSAADAQSALINAMLALTAEQLGVSAITSRTEFPAPLPDIPTITCLRRTYTPQAVWVNKTGANISVKHVLRQGVAYLIFGDPTLLANKTFLLPQDLNRRNVNNQRVLKGMIFVSAFEKNSGPDDATPDEAPIEAVSLIGDIDGDGFVDIMLGAPQADLINIIAPSERRQASGEAYLIYGNSFGLNDSSLP